MIEGSQKEINIHNPYKSVATVLLRFSSFLFLSLKKGFVQHDSDVTNLMVCAKQPDRSACKED